MGFCGSRLPEPGIYRRPRVPVCSSRPGPASGSGEHRLVIPFIVKSEPDRPYDSAPSPGACVRLVTQTLPRPVFLWIPKRARARCGIPSILPRAPDESSLETTHPAHSSLKLQVIRFAAVGFHKPLTIPLALDRHEPEPLYAKLSFEIRDLVTKNAPQPTKRSRNNSAKLLRGPLLTRTHDHALDFLFRLSQYSTCRRASSLSTHERSRRFSRKSFELRRPVKKYRPNKTSWTRFKKDRTLRSSLTVIFRTLVSV